MDSPAPPPPLCLFSISFYLSLSLFTSLYLPFSLSLFLPFSLSLTSDQTFTSPPPPQSQVWELEPPRNPRLSWSAAARKPNKTLLTLERNQFVARLARSQNFYFFMNGKKISRRRPEAAIFFFCKNFAPTAGCETSFKVCLIVSICLFIS